MGGVTGWWPIEKPKSIGARDVHDPPAFTSRSRARRRGRLGSERYPLDPSLVFALRE